VKRILFVCTGNTCRSPMAEGLFRLMAQREGLDVDVRSAGVSAGDGYPISTHSQNILRKRGMEESLSSKSLSRDMLDWADLVLTMTSSHKRLVLGRYPVAVDKTFTLREFVEDDLAALEAIAERERLITELEIKRALAQPVMPEERDRLAKLDRMVPNCDISDPYGGSSDDYQRCAADIERCLDKLIRKLKG
jgi:protein-tyrosine-phosphatase